MKIQTSFDYLPLSVRTFDWSAIDADTYDADADQDGFYSTHPTGHGATEQAAIADLLEQLEIDMADQIDATNGAVWDEKLPALNASFIGAVQ